MTKRNGKRRTVNCVDASLFHDFVSADSPSAAVDAVVLIHTYRAQATTPFFSINDVAG
jgi:hypothetical protein